MTAKLFRFVTILTENILTHRANDLDVTSDLPFQIASFIVTSNMLGRSLYFFVMRMIKWIA